MAGHLHGVRGRTGTRVDQNPGGPHRPARLRVGGVFRPTQTYRRVEEDRPPGITPRPGDGCLGDFTLPLEQSNPGRDETKRPRVKLNRDAVWEVLDRPGMSRNQLARLGGPSSGYFSHVPRPVAAGTDGSGPEVSGPEVSGPEVSGPEVSGGEAVTLLDSCRGIGPRTAGCVALMSLEKLDAFPVDAAGPGPVRSGGDAGKVGGEGTEPPNPDRSAAVPGGGVGPGVFRRVRRLRQPVPVPLGGTPQRASWPERDLSPLRARSDR